MRMCFGHNGAPLRVHILAGPGRHLGEGQVGMLARVKVVLRRKGLELRKRARDAVVFLGVLRT